jgi:hypothetical protein
MKKVVNLVLKCKPMENKTLIGPALSKPPVIFKIKKKPRFLKPGEPQLYGFIKKTKFT